MMQLFIERPGGRFGEEVQEVNCEIGIEAPVPRLTKGRLSPISLPLSPTICSTLPMPSIPNPLEPQHLSDPFSMMAQAWEKPPSIASALTPVPRSVVARLSPISFDPSPMVAVLSIPSCPCWFRPQHFTSPLSRTTQTDWVMAVKSTAVRPVPISTKERSSPISLEASPWFELFPRPRFPY